MAETVDVGALLDQIIERYRPGGAFGDPERALLKREKTKSLARTSQDLVSRGLAGTTAGAGAGRLWEEEVGMPTKLRLEDIRSERLTSALGAKAGYAERTEAQKRQIALEEYRIREQAGPTLAERGLDAFGQPFTKTKPAVDGGGGAGGGGGQVTHAGGGGYTVGGGGGGYIGESGSYGYGSGDPGYTPGGGNIGDISGGPRMDLDFAAGTAQIVDQAEQAWREFHSKNPYYFKGKEVWLRENGFGDFGSGGGTAEDPYAAFANKNIY